MLWSPVYYSCNILYVKLVLHLDLLSVTESSPITSNKISPKILQMLFFHLLKRMKGEVLGEEIALANVSHWLAKSLSKFLRWVVCLLKISISNQECAFSVLIPHAFVSIAATFKICMESAKNVDCFQIQVNEPYSWFGS